MIYYKIGDVRTDVTIEVRKDATVNVNINVGSIVPNHVQVNIIVTAHLDSLMAQVALSHTMEALRHQYPRGEFILDLPYTPYARQDRRCNPGEAIGIKVFGDYINRMDFKSVILTDPHSIAAEVCIDRAQVIDQVEVFGKEHDFGSWYIVAPDMGAKKKAEAFAKATCAKGVITCYKERNMYTGEILSQGIIGGENVPSSGGRFFVLDDICDGGRTFVGVAGLLSARFDPSEIELAVTHGIFSYGTDVVTDVYDHVYTTNSFNPRILSDAKITVIKID